MKNREILCAALALGAILCSGCGAPKVPEEITVSSIVVDKDAAVTVYLVDTFDQSYYSVDELQEMAAEEVDAYNAEKGGSAVLLQNVEMTSDGGNVRVSYYFTDAADYAEFLDTEFYYGTIEQSGSAITDLNQVLYDVDGSSSITTVDLMGDKLKDRHVIVAWEPEVVYAPYAVSYVSEQTSVEEDGSVDLLGLSEDEFPVVIVLKK